MTKEELEKEAEDKKPPYAFCAFDTKCELWKDGYKKGAEPREKRIAELEQQIERMKAELHHRLVSPPDDGRDCLDKIVGLDNLWQFGEAFYKEIKGK